MMRKIYLFFLVLAISTASMTLTVVPPGQLQPYINGVFPTKTPGFTGSWTLGEVPLTVDIPSPLKMIELAGTDDILVLSKRGEVYRVSEDGSDVNVVLDIRDRNFKLGDSGATGFALHPQFSDPSALGSKYLYVFYRYKPDVEEWSENGYNRLSRFTWDPGMGVFDANSELILIQQFDRGVWHNGGAMAFGPEDGFLYLTLGDEGMDAHQAASTQRLDGGLFNGMLRIDVDNDPQKSQPIRRQPLSNASPPNGWPSTYSQGYGIPKDNPWISESGEYLDEFFSIGLRSPYTMHIDAVTGQIWVADVGSSKREEVNLIKKADNHQWPFMEGSLASEIHNRPADLIGNEQGPYFEYDRSLGSCIVGGGVYRGDLFPSLKGQYLFADYIQNNIMSISAEISTDPNVLISEIAAQPVELPLEAKIAGVHIMSDGNVYFTMIGENHDVPGKILKLEQTTFVPDPPSKLSELGVFTDLNTLEVIPGVVPYTVNSPLWSDGAEKKRWIALPNDGVFDDESEQIVFSKEHDWKFPEGTVFIKQFDLPTELDGSGELTRLETRFFVIGEDGDAYGLTYRWNEEGTEAYLITREETREIEISEGGEFLYFQKLDFPSRAQCMTCHNRNAKLVLGLKTHQLNGEMYYPHLDRTMNQLTFMNESGMFTEKQANITSNIRSYSIVEEEGSLETKVRSYLDANCSSCHRDGGIPDVYLDFRFNSSQNIKNYLNFPTASHASSAGGKVIVAGEHEQSELWIRDASEEDNMMPPLGRNFVDGAYVDSLARWIDGLEELSAPDHDLIIFPNPSPGWLGIRINEAWEGPFDISLHTINGHLTLQTTSEVHFLYLDLAGYPAGSYVATVSNGAQRQRTKFVTY